MAKLLKQAGYRCACIVEHESFVEFSEVEARQLEAACAPGGSCEGLVLLTGAEGRSHSAWGEHLTFVANHADLIIATHPNTVMTDGIDQVSASRFTEDSSFENVNFLEIFNGWGRHFKPHQYWLATQKWDDILTAGCRVFAVADDDSMLDFPGVGNSSSSRPEIRGKGLPNQFGGCGFGWSMVYMGHDRAGTTEAETCGMGVGAGGDQRGRAVRQRLISAMSQGRFYCSTGVTISAIEVEGDRITVRTADAERLFGSIDGGEIVAMATGQEISFRVPPRATYARVTASRGEGVHHIDGEQFAWTQPFWVSVGGVPRSVDPRHQPLGRGWQVSSAAVEHARPHLPVQ